MFVIRPGTTKVKHLSGAPIQGRLLILPATIRVEVIKLFTTVANAKKYNTRKDGKANFLGYNLFSKY